MNSFIEDLKVFLVKNPYPSVRVISTLCSGGISCIGAVPRMFGAEVHCNADAYNSVMTEINSNHHRTSNHED